MRKILNEQQIVDNILSTGLYIETYDKCYSLITDRYDLKDLGSKLFY